jgi:hypothetical protein
MGLFEPLLQRIYHKIDLMNSHKTGYAIKYKFIDLSRDGMYNKNYILLTSHIVIFLIKLN